MSEIASYNLTRTRGDRLRSRLTFALVLIVGIAATLLGTAAALIYNYRSAQSDLNLSAQRAHATLVRRFTEYETLVRSGQAVFSGSSSVSYEEWQHFTQTLGLGRSYQGVRELLYIARVPAERLPDFIRRYGKLIPGVFKIDPPGPRDVYCLETYKGPDSAEHGELGTDYCYGERPRQILRRAADNGEITVSGQLHFSYKQRDYQGVIVVGPVFDPSAPTGTLTPNRAVGWVSATVPVAQLLDGVMPANPDGAWRLVDASRDNQVIAAEGPWQALAPRTALALHESRVFTRGGRQWRLEFAAPFHPGLLPWLILTAGLIISLLLFFVIFGWSRLRYDALRLADRMTHALRENERLLTSITDNIFEGIYRGVPGKGLVYVNQALARMFGYPSAEAFLAAPPEQLYADADRREELRQILDAAGFYKNEEVAYQRRDGTRFVGVNNAVAVYGEDGEIAYYDGVISDITERKRVEARVQFLAHYDALTGLPNRSLLRDRLDQALGKARREDGRLAVLFIDLDHFKNVNDSLGHDTGDELLREIGRRMHTCVRPHDTVSRQAGDEFVVLIPELRDIDSATAIAHKFLQVFREPVRIGEREFGVTGSIGIALYPQDGVSAEELIRNADAAMYSAKEKGRNNFQFFAHEMTVGALEKLALEAAMRKALERNEFVLHYQPQVELETGNILGFEALIRWDHPERGLLFPGEFIPTAEQSSLIVSIGDWVLEAACRQLRVWVDAGHKPVPVSVNLSAVQFGRGDIVTQVADNLRKYDIRPELLELELTESAIMRDPQVTSAMLRSLKDLGVAIAVDDFGVGYSSLSYLKRFHVDRLKIDRSFISDLPDDQDDAAIAAAIIEMAHALKLEVVAEGVETEAQLEAIAGYGCEMAQGFWFGRPVPAERIPLYLAK